MGSRRCARWGAGGILSFGQMLDARLVLGVAFTVLTWAVFKAGSSASGGLVLPIWIAQIGMLAVLTVSREAYGTAMVAGCFVVPCLLTSRWPCSHEVGAILRNSSLWWLASMLAAALAVRY